MLGILLIVELTIASRAFWRIRHSQKRSNLTLLVLQLSKTKQNVKTALVWLAFRINAHQNANQKPIGTVPAYRAQCTLPPQPIWFTRPSFWFLRVWFCTYPPSSSFVFLPAGLWRLSPQIVPSSEHHAVGLWITMLWCHSIVPSPHPDFIIHLQT